MSDIRWLLLKSIYLHSLSLPLLLSFAAAESREGEQMFCRHRASRFCCSCRSLAVSVMVHGVSWFFQGIIVTQVDCPQSLPTTSSDLW